MRITRAPGIFFAISIAIIPPNDTPINTGGSPTIPAPIRPAYSPIGSSGEGTSHGNGNRSTPGRSSREKIRSSAPSPLMQ